MTLEIMDFEEYQKKQATRLQNPPPRDVKIPKEDREQDRIICRGGWYMIPKKTSSGIDHFEKTIQLQNPLLLGVKMFLADVIYLSNMQYDRDHHNCSNFSKEVREAATRKGIRCGYVVISWVESEMTHAIVAFETDYGLKFFEPQLAEEEDVIIGQRYSVCLSGDVNDKIISKVEIFWNDGTNKIME
jgi:hypothetical protein